MTDIPTGGEGPTQDLEAQSDEVVKQTTVLSSFRPEIFRSRGVGGGSGIEKTPEEMGLTHGDPTELRSGDQVYLRRDPTAGVRARSYYPVTVVDRSDAQEGAGGLALSSNTNLPSWPPGYGQPHPPGYIVELSEPILAELYVLTEPTQELSTDETEPELVDRWGNDIDPALVNRLGDQ